MDIYSLASSTHSVIEYLERIDPQAAEAARMRYSCFDRCRAANIRPPTPQLIQCWAWDWSEGPRAPNEDLKALSSYEHELNLIAERASGASSAPFCY